jgi:hypothetical protein
MQILSATLVTQSKGFQVIMPHHGNIYRGVQQSHHGTSSIYSPPHQKTMTRLFAEKSFLEKAGDAIKSIIPFGKKNTDAITKKQKAKEEVSSSIDKIFQDAPLGVRMFGKMMKPLVSSIAGNLAEAVEEQSRQMSDLLSDARGYIIGNAECSRYLGEPIEVSSPFSQSSSTVSINGKTESRISASFTVTGRNGSAVATMNSSNGIIDSLYVNVNGRNIAIDTRGSSTRETSVFVDDTTYKKASSGLGKNHNRGKIIDAEFVDKKVNK